MRLVIRWGFAVGLARASLCAGLAALAFSPASAEPWIEAGKLRGSGGPGETGTALFGQNAAVDGDTAIFGAPSDDSDSGAAYIFTRGNSGAWTRQAKLAPPNSSFGRQFGHSVDIDGNTAIIGNFEEDINSFSDFAWIFVRDGSGRWTEQARLEASDAIDGDAFAYAVAIDGNTALVGTRPEAFTGFAEIPGAVYVFVRGANGVWTERAKLQASDGEIGDTFGKYVAIDGDVALIGRPLNDFRENSGTVRVSAYVFTRNAAGNFSERQKLLAGARTVSNGPFGPDSAVAVHGARALVTAGRTAGGRGLAYAFGRTPAGWRREGVLASNDVASNFFFGWSGALSGNVAIVGAPLFGGGTGMAYVFSRNAAGDWRRQQILVPADGADGDAFGHGVAATRGALLVGAPRDQVSGSDLTGSAYVFRRVAGGATQVQVEIVAAPAAPQDRRRTSRSVSVAVLSDVNAAFDPLQVSIPTVRFGPRGAVATAHEVADVNADGIGDLLLRFDVREAGLDCDDGAELSGVTFAGERLEGRAASGTAGCD